MESKKTTGEQSKNIGRKQQPDLWYRTRVSNTEIEKSFEVEIINDTIQWRNREMDFFYRYRGDFWGRNLEMEFFEQKQRGVLEEKQRNGDFFRRKREYFEKEIMTETFYCRNNESFSAEI